MALDTRLRTLLRVVDADIKQLSEKAATIADQLQQRAQLRAHLVNTLGGAPTPVAPNGAAHKAPIGKRPAAVTIPGRVLDIVGEFDGPVTMKQILGAKHGAKPHHITSAVTALVRSGHLVALGATSQRRYQLPTTPKRRGR
jgi:hypothetical protein